MTDVHRLILQMTGFRSLFVLEGRRRATEEMKAKSDLEKSKERIYAEVLKIKFARKNGVSMSDQDVDMTYVYKSHPTSSML